MVKDEIYCDICGKKFGSVEKFLARRKSQVYLVRGKTTTLGHSYDSIYDLCPGCQKKLLAWFKKNVPDDDVLIDEEDVSD